MPQELSHGTHISPLAERTLLKHVLRKVSRSFYLSLTVLPKSVRRQVSLAYLFCRVADTIADTDVLSRPERFQVLETFRRQFIGEESVPEELTQLHLALHTNRMSEGEQQLLACLPDCFQMLRTFSVDDQQLIRELVLTLTRGMQMDLKYFPGETTTAARALPNMPTLDLYTYYVAGVVGEFWTKLHAAHLPALRQSDCRSLCALAISFGKGLQLTNILKDLGKDLYSGRCYLPEIQLEQCQLRVLDLYNPAAQQQIRPLLRRLVIYALAHFDRAHEYILSLPRRSLRLRLSCMWPLLFALRTLSVVYHSPELLHPTHPIKISRSVVYRTMLVSLACLMSSTLFTAYYHAIRSRLASQLDKTTAPPNRILPPNLQQSWPLSTLDDRPERWADSGKSA
jgi:farnesyl-diphosphate farnesyltransferase